MAGNDLWKYCTSGQAKEMLRSFGLLDGVKIKEETYFSCLYALGNHAEEHYHAAEIPKKGGKTRKLLVPDYLLGRVQRNILHHVLDGLTVSGYARAYLPHQSIVENAKPHVGAKRLLKLDIIDFFQNISYFLVYRYAFPGIYFPPPVRTLLTHLCCFEDSLPQGAPTSPAVSNLVMKPFDEYIGNWCAERGIQYTRYCDDMTFSGEFDVREVKRKVRGFLAAYGFRLNQKKTQVQGSYCRQTVTGIVVNEKLQVSRAYRRALRAEIYYCGKYGVESHLQRRGECGPAGTQGDSRCVAGAEDAGKRIGGEYGLQKAEERRDRRPQGDEACIQYLRQLLGKINYVLQVNPEDQEFWQARERIREMLEQISILKE